MSIWANIRAVLKKGEDPTVKLDYSMLKVPELRSSGRPNQAPHELSDVEKAAIPILGKSKRRLCANPYCKTRVGETKYVCSEACRQTALMNYQAVVDLLGGAEPLPVKDVPDVENPPIARGLSLVRPGAGQGNAGQGRVSRSFKTRDKTH